MAIEGCVRMNRYPRKCFGEFGLTACKYMDINNSCVKLKKSESIGML
jgi:hypothetical protein